MMKTLYLRLIILFVAVLSLSFAIDTFIYKPSRKLPWSYVSDLIYLKSEFYTQNQDKFNAVFIGSSIVRRGFNCEVFDQNVDTTFTIKSFNFGINWLGFPESLHFIDNIALKNNGNLKYVFIELTKLKFVDAENMHTARSVYWYNLNYLKFTVEAALASPSSGWILRIALIASHLLGYVENSLNIDYFKNTTDFESRQLLIADSLSVVGPDYRGFDCMDDDVKKVAAVNSEENVQAAVSSFLKDTSGLEKRRIMSANGFSKFEKDVKFKDEVNTVYLDRLNSIVEAGKKQNIYVIYVLTPKTDKRQYDELIPLFYKLSPQHRINLADSRKYPDLYSFELAGDETHLNRKGAHLFSEILAREFNQIMRSQVK
ncbi:MAG: hypothetical protein IPP71_21190 [Bacteroidetes bacterium]|nr:hypothetical protein [Bacteroidota bacterium]